MKISNELKLRAMREFYHTQTHWVETVSEPEYLRNTPPEYLDELVKTKMLLAECKAWLEKYDV